MINRVRSALAQTAWAFLLGVSTLAVVTTSPAAASPAPNNCDGTGTLAVELLGLRSAVNATMMAQTDGSYATNVQVRVFCTSDTGADIGEVSNAQVAIWIELAPGRTGVIKINGQVATEAAPATISAPEGIVEVTISSTDPNILNIAQGEWRAKVGYEWSAVASAFGTAVDPGDSPLMRGTLWAQTPELSSLALFGTGAAGMAGYALTRMRAFRKRRD